MVTTTQTVTWEFGGWLARQPTVGAWTLLGAAAVVGAAVAIWSYRRALVELPPVRRAVLGALRIAAWLALLTILAAPTRIERKYEQPATRPLAVLVDRSGSMTTPDNRQRRRLDDALVRWRSLEPAAGKTYEEMKAFAFAETVRPVPAADADVGIEAEKTHLFTAMQRVLTDAPPGGWGGVVVLTDGLDTSGTETNAGLDLTARAAIESGTSLFFVPGRNRFAGGPYFTLREFTVPPQTAPHSVVRVSATFDAYQPHPRDVEVRFSVNGVERPATLLRVEAGRRFATWSADVTAETAGMLDLELKAGDQLARATVRVEMPPTNRILYFQGALDWSYRFLADILKRDATFALTPVFNFPNRTAGLPAGALARMPATEAELTAFDIVILANVVASQLSTAQQTALDRWVRGGGVLLFLTPDDDSTTGFVGSELEKMLPVVFSPVSSDRGGGVRRPDPFRLRGGGSDPTTLVPYSWEQTPQVREIFEEAAKTGAGLPKPLFSNYARVAGAKPGAEVLARHPVDTVAGGNERAILLALQRYGRGRTGVLTTDALWRWKLNQPTTERGAELFWQQLFGWLTRDRQRGLAFEQAPLRASTGREIALRLIGAGAESVQVEAVLGAERVALTQTTTASGDVARVFPWQPEAEGYWQIQATDGSGRRAQHWLLVERTERSDERSGLPPDETLLRTLADRTGGAVLDRTPPAGWNGTRGAGQNLLAERKTPLWHGAWMLGALLGVYGIELGLRRRWKLL